MTRNPCILLEGPGRAGYTIAPSPDQPILRVAACGICATDRKGFDAPPASMRLPIVPGHELCGIHLESGKRVAVWPAISCGRCKDCLRGRDNLCPDIKLFGLHCDGGWQRFLSLPLKQAQRMILLDIPDELGWEQACLAEPLGCVLHAFSLLGKKPGSLCIYGAGLMGRLAARLTRHLFPTCTLEVRDPDPIRQHGFSSRGPEQVDLVFPACSDAAVVTEGIARLAPGGTMLLFSGLIREYNPCPIDYNRLHRLELTLTGSYGCLPSDMARALDLMAAGMVKVDDLITEVINLEEAVEYLRRNPSSNDFKTIIRMADRTEAT